MFFRCAALACVFLCAPAALACSLKSGAQPFVVQGQGSSAPSEGLKAPVVEVVSITRGIGTRHASCDDTGLLSLKVEGHAAPITNCAISASNSAWYQVRIPMRSSHRSR